MLTRDTRTESFLTQMGVKYVYTNALKVSDLPPGWDVTNDGRPVALRDDAIIEYACLMESGSPAPAVILHKDDMGVYRVLDGTQRLSALIAAGFSSVSAYVVSSDSEDTLMAIRVLANLRLQGHAEPVEWTKRNAVRKLVIDRGMSPTEVAKLGGWKPSDIARLVKVIEWGFQIRCIGGPERLSDGIVLQIAELATHEDLRCAAKPIAAFLNAIDKGRFSALDAEPHIKAFFSPATKRDAIKTYSQRLDDFRDEPEVDARIHGRAVQALSVGVNLSRALKSVVTILDHAIEDGERLLYIDEFFQLTKKIDARLRKLSPRNQAVDIPAVPADMWADKS